MLNPIQLYSFLFGVIPFKSILKHISWASTNQTNQTSTFIVKYK